MTDGATTERHAPASSVTALAIREGVMIYTIGMRGRRPTRKGYENTDTGPAIVCRT